ncbi:hypothetical protein ADIARSV_4187 [Arcticibacter svalbardensis MN12-7]|uniref:Heparinase II/III-like C-terminal domain-containing protein n=1 Tax=Arcticibacter svalbardensis MN12-7 TaxID=1150600 RepID=R9GME1_9SPHI|nr:heparinase II/III family protein [Arcticibacter svalbardensis]EOR92675.1 hypothetical protein ADIARSV_4187 [Arcticibacter svalbardensis MN12-7]
MSIQYPKALFFMFFILSLQVSAQSFDLLEVKTLPPHPRILLLAQAESGIKKSIQDDSTWKGIHELILQESRKMLTHPPVERVMNGRRLLSMSRESLRRIFFLSYSWRMTRDSLFLKKAEVELRSIAGFTDWNPSHFLDVAEMTTAAAIGYDWLFPDLSAEVKALVKNAILKKGIEPSLKAENNAWLQSANNWNQVCNAGMAYGALAIYEDEPILAKAIITRSIKSVPVSMSAYAPDGAYPEGYGYWDYGTTFNILLIDALEKIFKSDFGLSKQTGFLESAAYMENMSGPIGKSFNYSDVSDAAEVHPPMFWLAKKQNKLSLLFEEKKYLQDKWLVRNRILPALIIWGEGIPIDKIEAPKELMWVGKGPTPVALMRTSWVNTNALFVGIKGGMPSSNHSHMDAGSFVMDANNERWAMDLGMQDYNSLESKGIALWDFKQTGQRWDVLRYNNYYHNTITLNNELQLVDGFAPITNFTDKPSFLSASIDLSQIYRNAALTVKRGIAIVDRRFVMIRDELISADTATTYRWVMLTPANVKLGKNGTAELSQHGKKLQLKAFGDAGITIKTWNTEPVHDYDAPNPGVTRVGFEVRIPKGSKRSFTVLLIPENDAANKGIENLQLKDWSSR